MTPAGFIKKRLFCAICGDSFEVLTSPSTPGDVACTSCGLRYSSEERQRRIEEKKAGRRGGRT